MQRLSVRCPPWDPRASTAWPSRLRGWCLATPCPILGHSRIGDGIAAHDRARELRESFTASLRNDYDVERAFLAPMGIVLEVK